MLYLTSDAVQLGSIKHYSLGYVARTCKPKHRLCELKLKSIHKIAVQRLKGGLYYYVDQIHTHGTDLLVSHDIRLGLRDRTDMKKGLPSPRARTGQENIPTVHRPKPIQTMSTPCGQGRRAMRGPHGPRTQVCEGAYAIKVSMKNLECRPELDISHPSAHGPRYVGPVSQKENS